MIVIEKDKPMPGAYINGNGRPGKWPFAQMEVGDSFWVPQKLRSAVQSAASRAQAPTGYQFTIRKENNGTRVWRIA